MGDNSGAEVAGHNCECPSGSGSAHNDSHWHSPTFLNGAPLRELAPWFGHAFHGSIEAEANLVYNSIYLGS
jgi:hypothetical protein